MRVIKDSFIYIAGELLAKGIPFLLLPYLTRKLGLDGFGELSYLQVVLAFCIVFVGLSQSGAISRYFYFYGKRSIGLIFVSGHIYSFLVTVIIGAIFIIQGYYSFTIVLLVASSQEILSVHLTYRQCQKKAIEFVALNVSNSIIATLLTIMFFEFLDINPDMRFISMLIANVVMVILSSIIIINKDKVKLKFSFRKYKLGLIYIFSFGIPLVFHQISIFAKGQIDRFFIYDKFTPADLALYAASFQVASVLSVLILAINKALIPYYYNALKSGFFTQSKTKKLFYISILMVPLVTVFVNIIPGWIYVLYLGEEYAGAKKYIVLFSLGILLMIPYLILVNYHFFYGNNILVSSSTMISSVIYVLYIYIASEYSVEILPFGLIIYQVVTIFLLFLYLSKKNKKHA